MSFLLQNAHKHNQCGDVIRSTFQVLQLIVGTKEFFLNAPFKAFHKALPRTWITNVWQFSSDTRVTYDYDLPCLHRRQNDRYLMDVFVSMGYRGTELKYLILCRLYLQVLTVSDIVDVNGNKIAGEIKRKTRRTDIPMRFNWPNQPAPPDSAWRT